MKFRKKPIIIEAIQLNDNRSEIEKFIGEAGYAQYYDGETLCFVIKTLEGDMIAEPEDWIIKGIKGEFYPCKNDVFEQTYEEVKE
jgi:hypothetical protein